MAWEAPKAWAEDALQGIAPAPTEVARFDVSVGNDYPAPWSGVERCTRPFQPGCFRVKEVTPTRVVLDYPRVELHGGALKPQGFRYVTPVTVSGSGYELFVIKHGGGREEWIYAFLETVQEARASLRFIKLPAFVTERARLTVSISVDFMQRRFLERYKVEAEEPLTLIGVGRLKTIFPGGHLEGIEINGVKSALPYSDIIHFNLPAGRHDIVVAVAFDRPAGDLMIQGTLLEARRMSLTHGLDLRVKAGRVRVGLEVRTVGLPNDVWEIFRSTLVVEPPPTMVALDHLAVRYGFGEAEAVTLKARPRIPVGPNNYPVMISVTALGGP
jgi:hypothetical protein